MRSILYLKRMLLGYDLAVSESMLWHMMHKIKKARLSKRKRYRIIKHARSEVRRFRYRLRSYKRFWGRLSCPRLRIRYSRRNYCGRQDSYEGMPVTIKCTRRRKPTRSTIVCVRRRGRLRWSAKPRCKYSWSRWGPWSVCSKPCGGEQIRWRRKPTGQKDSKMRRCK